MTGAGSSLMGQGTGTGKTRARDAALAATSSPLLDVGIERARGIVWNVTGPPDMSLAEVNAAAEVRGCLFCLERAGRESENKKTIEAKKTQPFSKTKLKNSQTLQNSKKRSKGRLRPRGPGGQPHLRRRRRPGPGRLGRALDHADRYRLRRRRPRRLGRRAVHLVEGTRLLLCAKGRGLRHRHRRRGGALDARCFRFRCFFLVQGRARDRDPCIPPPQARQVEEERKEREEGGLLDKKRRKEVARVFFSCPLSSLRVPSPALIVVISVRFHLVCCGLFSSVCFRRACVCACLFFEVSSCDR